MAGYGHICGTFSMSFSMALEQIAIKPRFQQPAAEAVSYSGGCRMLMHHSVTHTR